LPPRAIRALAAVLLANVAACGAPPTAPELPPAVIGFKPIPPPPPPRLRVTKLLAFGDSITEGKVSLNLSVADAGPAHTYPAVLLELLTARYTAQQFTMANEGYGGSRAAQDVGRFAAALDVHRPEVVLLLEGVNDLALSPDELGIEQMADGLRDELRTARQRNIPVFLSTLTAQKESVPGVPNKRTGSDALLAEANDVIRRMAAEEGAFLVDGFAVTSADPATLVSGDGLHLTVAGYQALAGAFFAALQTAYELPPEGFSRHPGPTRLRRHPMP
jgi:lysophospholipase L1-like esterase